MEQVRMKDVDSFLRCLSRLQSLRWTEVFVMPGAELPLKKLCSCLCHPSQIQRLWKAQEHSEIVALIG